MKKFLLDESTDIINIYNSPTMRSQVKLSQEAGQNSEGDTSERSHDLICSSDTSDGDHSRNGLVGCWRRKDQ